MVCTNVPSGLTSVSPLDFIVRHGIDVLSRLTSACSLDSVILHCMVCKVNVILTSCSPFGRIIVVPEYDAAMTFEQIEAEVLKMFNRSDIVTPDEVRGNYSTLAEAVLTDSRCVCS